MAHLLAEMGWPDVAAYLEQDDRIILPTGSTEQHGRHLPLGTDTFIPQELACRLSEQVGVLVAPAVAYGMSLHHLGFPGSLSLRPETLARVVEDILRSLYRHGFRRVLVLNGHGGNVASLQMAVVNVSTELADVSIRLRHWWREPLVDEVLKAAIGVAGAGHADAGETAPMLALRPDVVHLERAQHSPDAAPVELLTELVFRQHFPHGVIGADPRLASAELGARMLAALTESYVAQLNAW
ncbi:MAG: creatininase family protein [Chloroflexota bacterium]